ncbi:MAG: hypothetical protein ACM3XZ_07045 [Betaproteobacteria bacterium]
MAVSSRTRRRQSRWLLAAVLMCALFAWTASAASGEEFQLSAESIEHNLETDLLTASGQVDLRLKGLEARGELLKADLGRHVARMLGPVTLITSSDRVTGTNLHYAWDKQQGSLEQAETVTKGIRLYSQAADVSPGQLVLRDGLFTKCLLPTPEYAFLARQVEVDLKKEEAVARGVTLALYGRRVLPLPNLRFSLKDTPVGRMSRERLPIPTLGYDSKRGYFVADEVPVHLSDKAIALVGAGYGSIEGASLTLSGLYAPRESATLSLESRWVQNGSDLDGRAEFTTSGRGGRLVLRAQEEDDENGFDLAFLPQLAWEGQTLRRAGFALTPALDLALIRERASGAETWRQNAVFTWSTPSLRLPGRASLGATGSLRASRYGTDETLEGKTLTVRLDQPLSAAFTLETAYHHVGYRGTTPFAFDKPDPYTEGEVGLSWRQGGQTLSFSVVYDLAQGPPEPGRPAALKGSAALVSGPWELTAGARYELEGKPYYSTLNLALVRHLHCFDVSLVADAVEKEFSLKVTLR